MNKDYKNELRKLLKQARWKVVVFNFVINSLLLWQTVVDYWFYINFNFLFARRAFVKRTVQRAHYVGTSITKPHRLTSALLAFVLFLGIITAPHTQAMLIWSLAWGLVFSLYVILQSIRRMYYRSYNRSKFQL